MLDDHARRRLEGKDAGKRCIRVGDVVERQRLAMKLHGRADRPGRRVRLAIEARSLMWILAVAQLIAIAPAAEVARRQAHLLTFCVARPEPVRDRAVVGSRVSEGAHRKFMAQATGYAALVHGVEHSLVVTRVGNNGHARMILCSRPDHRGTADIDVLDRSE